MSALCKDGGGRSVFSTKMLTEQVLSAARSELDAWTRRYEQYDSLRDAARLVRQAMAKL